MLISSIQRHPVKANRIGNKTAYLRLRINKGQLVDYTFPLNYDST